MAASALRPGVVERMRAGVDKSVLVVEDDPQNMTLFTDLLELHGYRVLRAVNGEAVPAILAEGRPNLILMDIQLPGKSGIEVTEAIRLQETSERLPIVAITAFAVKGDEERFRDAGFNGFLSKPVHINEFLSAVEQFVT